MSIKIHHDSVLGSRVEYNTDDFYNDTEQEILEIRRFMNRFINIIKGDEALEIRRSIPSVNGI